ncbi:MAG: SatD family protein [Defluviitaleaceae bacterium]|nr:SatD family protein [Defluviitaleaceae bacterium]
MYCVVMGDIINSRELSDETRQAVKRAAQYAFDRINTKYMSSVMADFGMVRGDAFEGVILTQSYAPQIVRDIIKAFYSEEKTTVRISVVLGELSVTDGDRNKADGPAFYRALERLAELKKRNSRHWLQVHFDIGNWAQGLAEGNLALLSALTEGWTDKQREIVWAMENHDDYQKAVARKLNISAPVVTKQLKAANYEAYRAAWDGLTEALIKMDEHIVDGTPPGDESHIPFFNVALRMAKRHDFAGALKPALKALSKAKQNLNPDDAQFIAIYNMLAKIYTRTAQYEKAEESIAEALRIQESMPKARLEYAETLGEKAGLCRYVNNMADATKYYNEALDTARNAVNDGHPYIVELYHELAATYDLQGEYENAKELYYKFLTAQDKDKRPVEYAVTLGNIAGCYYLEGDFSSAISYYKKALRLFEDNLPPTHKYIVEVQNELSFLMSHREAGK